MPCSPSCVLEQITFHSLVVTHEKSEFSLSALPCDSSWDCMNRCLLTPAKTLTETNESNDSTEAQLGQPKALTTEGSFTVKNSNTMPAYMKTQKVLHPRTSQGDFQKARFLRVSSPYQLFSASKTLGQGIGNIVNFRNALRLVSYLPSESHQPPRSFLERLF